MARTCTCEFNYANKVCEHGFCVTPSGVGFKSHKALLGSPRTPYAKWAAAFSPYTWPLWHERKPRKVPRDAMGQAL